MYTVAPVTLPNSTWAPVSSSQAASVRNHWKDEGGKGAGEEADDTGEATPTSPRRLKRRRECSSALWGGDAREDGRGGRGRSPRLCEEVGHQAVEGEAIEVAAEAEVQKQAAGHGRSGAEELYIHVAARGAQQHLAVRGRLRQVRHGVRHVTSQVDASNEAQPHRDDRAEARRQGGRATAVGQ